MATYVTKKCPHCGYTYQFHQSGDQRKYGCPYQTCTRCKKSYWDKDIKEPALHGYKNFHETKEGIARGITIILYGCSGILLFLGGIFLIVEFGDIMGVFLLIIGIFSIWAIYSHFKQKFYDMQHKDKIIANQQKNYDASMERLKDTNYLIALAKLDSRAKRLLDERIKGIEEHYANRPK